MNPLSLISPTYFGIQFAAAILCVLACTTFLSWIFPTIMDRVLPPPILTPFYTFLPFRKIHEDGKTIIMNSKAPRHYIRVIFLQGADINLCSESKHEDLYQARKIFLDSLEDANVTSIKFISTKEKTDISSNLLSDNPVLRDIQKKWMANFPDPTEITHYLIIAKTESSYDRAKISLDAAETKALQHLSEYSPHVMREYDTTPSGMIIRRNESPLNAFAIMISPISRPKTKGMNYTGPISALINTDEISFAKVSGSGIITFRHGNDVRWSSVITYRDCGEQSTEAVCRELLAMNAELLIYHAMEPIPTHKAITTVKYHKQIAPLQHGSTSSLPAYDHILVGLEGNDKNVEKFTMMNYAIHIIPFCKTRDELERVQMQIQQKLTSTRGTTIPLTSSAQPTFMSMLDPNATNWPRRFRLPTDNVAASIYPQSSIRAHIGSDWCKTEPVAWIPTVNGDPFPFNFHFNDGDETAGHTVLIGPTGAGKTTFTTLMAALGQRIPDLKTIMLDRLDGMKVFTNCVGGSYLDFSKADEKGIFNPLHLKDTPENRAFLMSWLKDITELDSVTAEDEFSRMIALLYRESLPMEAKSLRNITPIAFSPTGEVRRALEPWINPQQYGNIVNAKKECFNLDSAQIIGYNMTQVLNNPRLAGPIVSYILHSLQNIGRETKKPSLLIIDETKPMLANKHFAERLLTVVLQEARKQRQVCVLNFQSAGALLSTGYSETILNQCPTQVYFRTLRSGNEESMREYESFGLNSSEMDFIMGRTFKEHSRAVLIKRAYCESVIANIDISRLDNFATVFKSGAKSIQNFEDALKSSKTKEEAIQKYIHGTNY